MPFQSLPMPGDGDRWLETALAEPLYSAWNGYGSSPMGLTGINDDVYAAATLRNRGLGPAFLAQDTDGTTELMTIDDLGTTLTNLFGSGTADITGASTFGDTVDVTGAGTFGSTLDVAGATTLGDTLHVVGDVLLDAALEVGGDTIVQGQLEVVDAVTLEATLEVMEGVVLGDTLTVAGETILSAAVTLGSDVDDLITIVGHLPAGTEDLPALSIGESGTGLWWPQTGELALSLLEVERLRVTAAGVGIGTTEAAPPKAALHVVVTGDAPGTAALAFSVADGLIVEGADQAYINVVAPTVSGVVFSTPSTWSAGSIYYLPATDEVVISTSDGDQLRVGSGTLGFFNAAGDAQQEVEADASDLPTVVDLANSIKAALVAYGLVVEA